MAFLAYQFSNATCKNAASFNKKEAKTSIWVFGGRFQSCRYGEREYKGRR